MNELAAGDSFESFENFDENVETLVKQGHSITNAKRIAAQVAASTKPLGKGAGQGAAAQFDVIVTRNTATINAALPVALFGIVDLEGAYRSVLNNLPAGVTLTSVTNSNGNIIFTYADGAGHTDTITITCNQIAYASFIRASQTDPMVVKAIRYIVASNALDQFSQNFQFVKRSIFGNDDRMNVTPTTYLSPDQFQQNRVDMGNVKGSEVFATLDKETSINIGVLNAATSFTLSFFISAYDKLNARNTFK